MTTELVELADRLQLHAVIQRRRRYPENAALADEAATAIRALASRAGGPVMIGKMVEVEFSRQQITFKMQGDYHCTAGTYEIRRLPAAPEPLAVGMDTGGGEDGN